MPSGENGCGMGETNSSRQSSFESDLHAVDGGQRRFLRLTLSDSWIGVRVVYGTGLKTRDASASVGSNPTLSAISSRIHSVPGCFLHICASFHRTRIVFSPDGSLSDSVAICEHYVNHGCTQYTFKEKCGIMHIERQGKRNIRSPPLFTSFR